MCRVLPVRIWPNIRWVGVSRCTKTRLRFRNHLCLELDQQFVGWMFMSAWMKWKRRALVSISRSCFFLSVTWPDAGLWFRSWFDLCKAALHVFRLLIFCNQELQIFVVLLFIHWLTVHHTCSMKIYTDFITFICKLPPSPYFLSFFFLLPSGCPAPVDTNSLLAFIPNFLAHTASSICHCQVTMLINRSVLAAVKMRSCVVEARGSLHHLSSLWRAFPPTEPRRFRRVYACHLREKNSSLSPLCLCDAYQRGVHIQHNYSQEMPYSALKGCVRFVEGIMGRFPRLPADR